MYTVYLDKNLIHDLDSEDNVLIDPQLELELNKAGAFTFSMECTHPYYDKLERFKSIVQVLCDGDEIFKGRIIEVSDDMYKERTVYCESELAYLNDTIQRPYEFHLAADAVWEYLSLVIGSHNEQVDTKGETIDDNPRQFQLGEVTINDPNDYIYCYTNFNTTMDELKEDLVDDLGGYIRIRNSYTNNDPLGTLRGRYIDYINLEEYGKTGEQRIEFGENLLDFTNDINQADICTGIIPLGATLEESEYSAIEERVTIESVNGGSDYLIIPEAVEKYGLILKVVTWDDITEPSNLLRAGQAYLEEYDYEPQTITATAVDMHLTDEEIESWRLGDKIFVESEPHDLHKRFPLAQMSIPLDQPENTSVTLGTFEDTSLSGRNNRTETGLRNFENFQVGNVIASAVARATAIIDQHTNGYVTIHYDEERDCADEILIMDAPNTGDATRVWRWNLNGLGYSSTGYSGDDAAYGTAITMDGWILGNFIIANGMILADDTDIEFGKFDDKGMKIYAQSGREDLLLMRVGLGGMEVYNDETGTYTANLVRTVSVTAGYDKENSEVLFEPANNQTIVSCSLKSSSAPGYTEEVDYSASVESFGDAVMAFVRNFTVEDGITVSVTGTITVRTITTDPWLMSQIDGQGFRVYDQAGTVRTDMDVDSFDIYDSSGMLSMQLYADGLKNYDSDGTMRSFLSRSAFSTYHANGVQSMRLEAGVLSAYDTDGTLCYMQTYSGSYYYSNGNHIGTIGTSVLYSYPNEHGLVFSLTVDDEYMAFSHKDKDSDPYATIKLGYYSASCSYPEGVAFGDHAYMNNYELYFGTDTTGAYLKSSNEGKAITYSGDAFFVNGTLYYNGYEVATKQDINSLSTLESRIDKLEAVQPVPDEPRPMYVNAEEGKTDEDDKR